MYFVHSNLKEATALMGENRKKQNPLAGIKLERNKKQKAKKHHSKAFNTFLTVILSLAIIGIISVTSVAIYVLHDIVSIANGDVVIDLDEYMLNQSQTTILYAYDENGKEVEIARLHGNENRIWVPLEEMPKSLIDAYVAIEDKRFWDHSGVDWMRTLSVVVKYRFSQGGSTITQQLIKNLTGENGRTFIRKYREICYALNLEKHASKEKILETYLNTLYLDEGCYGVQTASEFYFGKDVSELNLAESACLAAITTAPRTYNPIRNFENNRRRQKLCLDYMLEQGKISKEEYDEALNYEIIFTNSEKYVPKKDNKTTKEKKDTYQSYYVDYVIDKVIADLQEQYNYTYNQAWRKLYYGGLKIYTAEDMNIQSVLEDIYYNRKTLPKGTKDGQAVQSAMTVMDYQGRLKGIVGRAGPKPGDRSLNIAAKSPRQPGSAIKPLSVYAPAIEKNYAHWSTLMQNYGLVLKDGSIWPKNYDGPGSPGSYKTIADAIPPSLNTVPARLVDIMTPKVCYDFLVNNFHISTATTSDVNLAPLAVGAMSKGVTTLVMAAAFATFGYGGKYYEPICYFRVTNHDGSKVYLQTQAKPEQVISEATADIMLRLLERVITTSNGTGRKYGVSGFETFAKTGTTTDNKDRWFVGGTPYYVAAVWLGYETPKDLSHISGNPAGQTFKTVMDEIHKGLEKKGFTHSEDVVKKVFCTRTGLLASAYCTSKSTGWYKFDHVPSTCTTCKYSSPQVNPGGVTTEPEAGEGNEEQPNPEQ